MSHQLNNRRGPRVKIEVLTAEMVQNLEHERNHDIDAVLEEKRQRVTAI